MNRFFVFTLVLLLITPVFTYAELRSKAEAIVDANGFTSVSIPDNAKRALPLVIKVEVMGTKEIFVIELDREGYIKIGDSKKSDILIQGSETDFLSLQRVNLDDSESLAEVIDNLEIKPFSLKGSLSLKALEKSTGMSIVKNPSLGYRLVGTFFNIAKLFV